MSEDADTPVSGGSAKWASLDHAYGPASDIPGLLAALTADNEEARADANEQLCRRLCHQDTLYTASVAAVPFLAAIASQPEAPLSAREDATSLAATARPAPARPHR